MIDHVVLATPDLDATVAELRERLGVEPSPGGKHVGFGTHNALLGLGGATYLEVVGPDPEQEAPTAPRPFGIDELTNPRLVTWAARVDDLNACVAAAKTAGYDAGPVIPMSRDLPDGTRLEWQLTFPPGVGDGLVPFLIDWGTTPHPSTTAPQGVQLVEFFGEHPEPKTVAASLRALGVELDVRVGATARLVAIVDSPNGRIGLT